MTDAAVVRHPDYAALRARWGGCVDTGLLIMPDTLLREQCNLELSTFEVVLILNIVACWNWHEDTWPRIATSTLAARLRTTPRTVQRALQRLGARGFVCRLPHKQYDLTGLVQELQTRAARDLRTAVSRGRRSTQAA